MKRIGMEKLRSLIPLLDSEEFSPEVFGLTGIFVIRKAIPGDIVARWHSAWAEHISSAPTTGRVVNRFNPVAFEGPLPPVLAEMYKTPAILNIVQKVFGPDLGLYNHRFVIKDEHSRGPVFLHQDYPYHLGWPDKASAFVPLVEVTPQSGGLTFFPGTHQFGYLGDAGEININAIDASWPQICPHLTPGDFALMHSLTWHSSGPHVSGPDRVMADIIYQPASDPSSIELLRGQWQTELFLTNASITRQDLFKRSRTSRLIELQRRVDESDAKQKKPN